MCVLCLLFLLADTLQVKDGVCFIMKSFLGTWHQRKSKWVEKARWNDYVIFMFQMLSHDFNRTMLFHIGRSEIQLINPEMKSVQLNKTFKDIAHCCQVSVVVLCYLMFLVIFSSFKWNYCWYFYDWLNFLFFILFYFILFFFY